jgi:RHS repeat-associated protein
MAAAQWIDAHTPSVSVVDSRSLAVRNVAYCRHPRNPSIETRITRNHFDAAGRLVASWDPRLWGTAPKPNLVTTHNLQNQPLLVDSVDAGWQLSLLDQAGMARSFWDGRGSQRHTEYDELLRPTTVTEQMKDEMSRVSERFAYGGAGEESAVYNQCGQLIRHDHPAGRQSLCEYGVGGWLLAEETRFMLDLAPPDWSSESADARLEDEVFRTVQQHGPSGEMLCQTDARGNLRTFAYNLSGKLLETRLRLAGASGPPQVLVGDIRYDALGKVERELAANGVLTTARYAAEDGRLAGLLSCDARGVPLQHLEYSYDPVGNISSVEDKVALTRYFNHQRIDPFNRYRYDSLYQLVEATGREVSQPGHGPALPAWQTTPLDPNLLRNYTQSFNYDAAGNLQTRHHSGAQTFEMFTSTASNRSVAEEGNLADGFDANGNQRELLRGQAMSWDIRNQLSRVTMVRREDGPDDTECYFYDSPGHRLRKVRLTETARRTLRVEVRYLPGLEVHRDTATGEERHVLSVEAGLGRVRALHWVGKLPKGVRNDQLRFCLSDHLNSCTLELDELGGVLSREVYYAFGGTALWASASETEAGYKTIRYSGKERDATGLYYYGYRYYAPWLQRWLSPDPLGAINGLNIYCFAGGQPVSNFDVDGRYYEWKADDIERQVLASGERILGRGLNEFSEMEQSVVLGGLNEIIGMLHDAKIMVSEYSQESEAMLVNFLGAEYGIVVDDVVKGWGRTKDIISGYQGDFGRDRFVKVEASDNSGSLANIYTGDDVGRIFVNKNLIVAGVNLNITLAHEFSHFHKVVGLQKKGASTLDFWGLPLLKDENFLVDPEVDRYSLAEIVDFSRKVMRGDAPEFFGDAFVSDPEFFTQAVSEASETQIDDFVSALGAFHKNAEIRSFLASKNADTSAYLMYALHAEYRNGLGG